VVVGTRGGYAKVDGISGLTPYFALKSQPESSPLDEYGAAVRLFRRSKFP